MKLSPSLRSSGDSHNEAIHKDKSQKVDSSDEAFLSSLQDTASAVAWQSISAKVDSRNFTQTAQPAHHDSRNCGGAVVALRFLGKVSELGVRAFHKNRNTAALPTQRRIA